MIYSYNFVNKLIYITRLQADSSLGSGIMAVTLLSDIREAEASVEGISYGQIVSASGGEALGSGVAVGITLNLLDDWQIIFETGTYIAKFSGGNLVGGLGGEPIAYSVGVQVLLLQSAASTAVTVSTGSGLSAQQDANLSAALAAAQAAQSKTASLTYSGNAVVADVTKVTGITITGAGTELDPWGP